MSSIEDIMKQFREVRLEGDPGKLPEDIVKALPSIKRAMDALSRIHLRQQHEHLPFHYDDVMEGKDEERKSFYRMFKGPWNPLNEFKSEYPDVNDRRAGCAFYPDTLEDCRIVNKIDLMTDEEEKSRALDHYTILRDREEGYDIIPYHVYFAEELAEVFDALEEAADLVEDEALSSYLTGRAEALVSGSYRDSDAEWVRLTGSPLDLVMGPYEVYADALMGVKAMYETMLLMVDHEKGAALKEIENNIGSLAEIFPLPAGSKGAVGAIAPIVVADLIYAGGEASQGIMAAAFNLPNDPWVRGNVGWKQVLLHNVMKGKFETVSAEIAKRILIGGDEVDFEPFFTFILLHEVSHGLGPAYRADGRDVSKCIGSSYVAIEETKADTGAICLMVKLGGRYGIGRYDSTVLLKTYLSGIFRSMRFGVHEAHGSSNLIQFNWLKEKGVIVPEGDRFAIRSEGIESALDALLEKICYLEAGAEVSEVEEFLGRYGQPDDELIKVLESLSDIPTDIRAVYPL